jgi:hypothetical protein
MVYVSPSSLVSDFPIVGVDEWGSNASLVRAIKMTENGDGGVVGEEGRKAIGELERVIGGLVGKEGVY